MGKKKIAVIGVKGLPPFGGAANVVDNLIDQLSAKYEFTIYATASATNHKGPYKGATQIIMRKFPIPGLNVLYYYIASAFHAVFVRRYDGIHLHQMDGAFILLLLRLKYKVIATSHGITYTNTKWSKWIHPYFKINEWFQAHLSNALTVVSRSLISHYNKMIPVEKINYIPNGITTLSLADTRTANGDYILFSAGRIIPIKGLHLLLSALRQIGFNGKLIVLGDLTQHKKYAAEVIALSNGLDVEFKGMIKEKSLLNAYISNARLFIFPSTIEAMSMMLLEVASLQTPVVCSDIVQNTDIFARDEMLFFQSESEADLAAKITWALANAGEMTAFAEKAFERLKAQYLWSHIAEQYDIVFKRVLQNSTE
jgi:glycosyltransferase involved in cell wall biosynthesis